MRKKTLRRTLWIILCIAILSGIAGFWAAPRVPYLLVYLPKGGFVAAYPTADQCAAARRAFSAGRGVPSGAGIVVGQNYINTCSYSDVVSIDMGPSRGK